MTIQNTITSESLTDMPIKPDLSREFKDIAHGCVDSIDGQGISGWYIHKSNTSSILKISINGIAIGYCSPKMLRPDISEIMGEDSNCGFFFSWSDVSDSQSLQQLAQSSDLVTDIEVCCVQTNRNLYHLISMDKFKSSVMNWIRPHLKTSSSITHVISRSAAIESSTKNSTAKACRLEIELTGLQKVIGHVYWEIKDNEKILPVELLFYSEDQLLDSIVINPKNTNKSNKISRAFSWAIPPSLTSGKQHKLEVRASSAGRTTVTKSLIFGHGTFSSSLTYSGVGKLHAFVLERATNSNPALIQICIDSKFTFDIPNSINKEGLNTNPDFEFKIPVEYLDGGAHSAELRVNGKQLQVTHFVHSLRGHIDTLNGEELSGWIYDPNSNLPVELVARVDGVELPSVAANWERNDVGRSCGFIFNLSSLTVGKAAFEVEILLRDIELKVLGTPKFYFRTDGLIEVVRKITSNNFQNDGNHLDQIAVAKYLGPRLIKMLRNEVGQSVILDSTKPISSNIVKVIVPVYDGVQETIRCLAGLFESKSKNKNSFDVILVDDRGPNPAIGQMLRKISERPDVTLITNDYNLGFVRSVNKALRFASGHDVVLLNADAVVNGNWLDRMRDIAYLDKRVASVTPFSNNATICSYPDPELENSMPEDLSLQEIDDICSNVNKGMSVEIPSGVGFCMYMKDTAISEVGLLDADRFGMGYGEENDWCVRARDLGWIHKHACDTFVEHIGGVSFGKDKKNNLVEKNLVILGQAYPEYTPIIMDFIKSDPARIYRNRISISRICESAHAFSEKHLYVTHSFGGGIEVFCKDQERNLAKVNVAVLMLQSIAKDVRITFGEYSAQYRIETELGELIQALSSLSLDRIHFNSDIGHPSAVWDLPNTLKLPYDVTVHDYTSVCPRVNFTTGSGKYCGEPEDVRDCDKCISKDGTYAYLGPQFKINNNSVAEWRASYKIKLLAAANVFVPDSDVAARMKRYYPELKVSIRPHAFEGKIPKIVPPRIDKHETMRIAVIGAIGPHKGFDLLHACVMHASENNLPLKFVVIGYTCDDNQLKKYSNVHITGKFEQDALEDILIEEDCHAALFLSHWPETYSYTLTEALLAGLWPVVLPIGALCSRVKSMKCGTVLPENAGATEINKTLISLAFA